MALAIFRTEGDCPVEKDMSKISLTCWEMSFFSSFKIFTGMLFGPDDLCESRVDIIKDISFLYQLSVFNDQNQNEQNNS